MQVNAVSEGKLNIYKQEVEQVGPCMHLGSIVSKDRSVDEDIRSQIREDIGAFFFLQLYPVWSS
jgi:hypothetical protein